MSSNDNLLKNTKRPDDMSIRGLLLKATEYFLLLLRRWWLIAVLALIFAGNSYYSIRKVKAIYPGEIVLLVNTQNTSKENKNRTLVFSRFVNSRKVFEKILLEPIDTFGGDLLINKYLQAYFKFKPEGLSENVPKDFLFFHTNQVNFSQTEAIVFKEIVRKISTPQAGYADGFVTVSVEEALGLITFGIATPDADLTILIINKLSAHFQDLIFNHSSFAETATYKRLKLEYDDLESKYRTTAQRLNRKRNEYKQYLELNGITGETTRRGKEIAYLEIEAEIYKSKYLVTLKELTVAEHSMNMKKPIVEIIQQTLPPLEHYRPSPLQAALKSAFIGAFFMIILIVLHQVFTDILKE